MLQRSAAACLLAQAASRCLPGRQLSVRFATSSEAPAPVRNGVLFIASRLDIAGSNLASTLLARGGASWGPLVPSGCAAGGEAAKWLPADESELQEANVWLIEDRLTLADDLDLQWQASSPARALPEDVIFLSRHASESAKKCLTVHPIGNPTLLASRGPQLGGRAGRSPPPSRRMSALLRAVKARVGLDAGMAEFAVCPEATHHGPWLEAPCCFVEIGSAADDWCRADAAACWADVLLGTVLRPRPSHTSPPPDSIPNANAMRPVVLIGVGGGHYAPKVWDVVAAKPQVALGHVVSSYALEFTEPTTGTTSEAGGGWRATLTEAVRSTQAAWSGDAIDLVALVDKKAFKAAQRVQVESLLVGLGVRVALTKGAVLPPP